jgi:hypothetical protein
MIACSTSALFFTAAGSIGFALVVVWWAVYPLLKLERARREP